MSRFSLGMKQIYGGFKTMFGTGGKKVAQKATQQVSKHTGPSWSEQVARQPLALPAPTKEQLAKDVPSVFVPKVTNGLNLNELNLSQEILRDGTHVRYYRAPGSNKILIKMEDKGLLHKEWVYGNTPDQFTYVKSIGKGNRYVLSKNGSTVQIHQQGVKYKDGINQTISTQDLYFSNGAGTGYHMNRTKGFNGQETTRVDIRGTHPDKFGKGEVQYQINNAISGRSLRRDDNVYKYCNDISYSSAGAYEKTCNKVWADTENAGSFVKQNWIDDIDEALFIPYKT